MYLRTANNFFKLLSLDRQVNEQTRRVVIFLYLRRAFLWIPYIRLQTSKGWARRDYNTWMYSIFHLPVCDAHIIAEMKIFLRYSKRQFWKAVLPPHRSATLTITRGGDPLQPPLLIPVIVRETSANASLYRALYVLNYDEMDVRVTITRKSGCWEDYSVVMQLAETWEKCNARMNRDYVRRIIRSRRIIRTDCVRTAVQLD